MFQVASRPAPAHHFPGHGHITWEHDDLSPPSASSYSHSSSSSSNVQLPRTLARPPFVEINRANVAAVAPELADVPAEYVRRGLRHKAPQMLAGLSALSPSHLPPAIPKSHLAQTPCLSIPIRSPSSPSAVSYPTHILAISPASKSSSSSDQIPLLPTHSLVLAAQCANLPRLPPTAPEHGSTLTLPILPLSVPAPAAFPALHTFLYTHRADTLLSALLPALPAGFLASLSSKSALCDTLASGPALHQLSVAVLKANGGQLGALMGLTKRVTGVWKDAVALGVFEPELWDVLDLAWEVLLGSLNLAAGMA